MQQPETTAASAIGGALGAALAAATRAARAAAPPNAPGTPAPKPPAAAAKPVVATTGAAKPSAKPAAKPAAGERCYDVAWVTLARSNQTFGNGTIGALKSMRGKNVLAIVPESSPWPAVPISTLDIADADLAQTYKPPKGFKATSVYSIGPDFPSFHTPPGSNTTYMLNHFESNLPSTMYISELAPSDSKGNLKIVDTRHVNATPVGGFWYTCSGSLTPWGSHIASEEFPPDCRVDEQYFARCKAGPKASASVCGIRKDTEDDKLGFSLEFARFYGLYYNKTAYGLGAVDFLNNQTALDSLRSQFNCYNYGSTPEVTVLPGGAVNVTKWRTIGRISHELAYVMPDNRTVYTTDDGSNGVLLRFVADRPGDLSSGALYTAKLSNQSSDPKDGKPTWDVAWIKLGSSNQAALEKLIAGRPRFSSIFDATAPYGSPPRCPPGFTASNAFNPLFTFKDKATGLKYQLECLRLKPGMEVAAAFLEPRRLASMRGATTKFEKSEGFTFSRRHMRAFMAQARIANGLTASQRYNYAGADNVQLPENKCGGVFAFDVGKDWALKKAKMLLQGDTKSGTGDGYACNKDSIAGPDNLHYVGGNLLIQEDTPHHANAFMWAYNVDTRSLTRVVTAPSGAEVSGISTSRVGDKAYLTMTAQHPGGDGPPATAEEMEAQRGYVGYIGPLPADIMSDAYTLRFEALPAPQGADRKLLKATARVCATPRAALGAAGAGRG